MTFSTMTSTTTAETTPTLLFQLSPNSSGVSDNVTTDWEWFGCSWFQVSRYDENGTMLQQFTRDAEYIQQRCHESEVAGNGFLIVSMMVGIPANILALAAMLTLRPRSIALGYISLLALFDLLSLVVKGIDTLLVVYEVFTHKLACGFWSTTVMFVPTYANWVLILICFERFFTLRFPLSKAAHFTSRRAKLLAGLLAFCLFMFFLPRTFLRKDPIGGHCSYVSQSVDDAMALGDDILFFYAPQSLLFIFVALIAWELRKAQKIRLEMFRSHSKNTPTQSRDTTKEGETTVFKVGERKESQNKKLPNEQISRALRQQQKNERALTLMMTFAAVFFLLMTLPICVVLQLYIHPVTGRRGAEWQLSFSITQGLVTVTHAANFVLYFITCRRLRVHLFRVVRRCCRVCSPCNRCCPGDRKLSRSAAGTEITKFPITSEMYTDTIMHTHPLENSTEL